MDIKSSLPGCSGQAADAISAYTQVRMEDAPTLLKIPKSECPDIWKRVPKHKWPKSLSSMEDQVVPLERNLYGHPLAGLLWERQFEKILLKHGWEKFSTENVVVNRARGLFLSVYVDDIKLAGKTENMEPTWKIQMKDVVLGHFLTTKIWDALKESVKSVMKLCRTTEICSNSGFLLEPWKNYRPELQGNPMPKRYLLGPMTWKVTRRNEWKDIANLRIKRLTNETKSQRHAWMIIIFKKKKMDLLENYPQFAHKLF